MSGRLTLRRRRRRTPGAHAAPRRGGRCTSFYFICAARTINYNTENERLNALQCSKQRAPGRKGLRGDGAVSCGRLRAAVVFLDTIEARTKREFARPHPQNKRRRATTASPGESRQRSHTRLWVLRRRGTMSTRTRARGYFTSWPSQGAGPGCLARRSGKSSDFEGAWLPLHASSRLVASRQPRASIQLTAL